MINYYGILFLSHLIPFWVTFLYTTFKKTHKSSLCLMETLPIILFNQFIITPVFITPILYYYSGRDIYYNNLFSYITFGLIKFILQSLLLNSYFSITHYLCHKIKYLFTNIHYIHHRLIITHGAGAIYCHPLEHIFVNLSSVILPIIVFQTDLLWSSILITYVSYETVIGHTPYINKTTSRHNLHHTYFNVNFDNSPYIFDKWIFKTYRSE